MTRGPESRCGYETPIGPCRRRALGRCRGHRIVPINVRGTLAFELYTMHDDATHRRWSWLRARRAKRLVEARSNRR